VLANRFQYRPSQLKLKHGFLWLKIAAGAFGYLAALQRQF